MQIKFLLVFKQAIAVVILPAKQSKTIIPSFVYVLIKYSNNKTGFCVGCILSSFLCGTVKLITSLGYLTLPFVSGLTKDVGRMLSSSKWKECFENGASLVTNNANEIRLDTAVQTSYFGAGVGGSIIGFGASMLDISDDLFKNMEDALSGVKNESVASWNEAARHSRIEKNCCSIDIGTRWVKNDTIGRNEGKYDKVVSIPALDENGKSFCEAVQTTEQYQQTRKEVSDITWNAEYQQQPMDIKGQLFKDSELQHYDALPDSPEANIAVCDTADTGSDYLSCPMAKKYGHLYYIYDVVFTQLSMDFSAPLLEGALKENKVQVARFESNNGGKLFAKGIEERVPETAFYWKVTSSNKDKNKILKRTNKRLYF